MQYFLDVSIYDLHVKTSSLFRIYPGFLETSEFYKSLKQYEKGVSLHNTIKYKKFKDKKIRKEIRFHFNIYDSIRKNGYDHEQYPIKCWIDKYGRIRLYDGFHRLTILKALNIETLKVKIIGVSKKWTKFKELLSTICYKPKVLYEKIEHPDFHDWEVHRGESRREILSKFFIEEKKMLNGFYILDLGCHTGYWSRFVSRLGAITLGVDFNKNIEEIFKTLNTGFGTTCDFIFEDVLKFLKTNKEEWDMIICLSLLHWFEGNKLESIICEMVDKADIIVIDLDNNSENESIVIKQLQKHEFEGILIGNETQRTETRITNRNIYVFRKEPKKMSEKLFIFAEKRKENIELLERLEKMPYFGKDWKIELVKTLPDRFTELVVVLNASEKGNGFIQKYRQRFSRKGNNWFFISARHPDLTDIRGGVLTDESNFLHFLLSIDKNISNIRETIKQKK